MKSAPVRSIRGPARRGSHRGISTPWRRLSTARAPEASLRGSGARGGAGPGGRLVMTVYRRILLVVDLTDESVAIGRKARALAAALGGEVELLHVVEFVPV